MTTLGLLSGLAGTVGVATGNAAAWAVMAVAVALGLAYAGALAHMRRLAVQDLTRAFGGPEDRSWDGLARELAISPHADAEQFVTVGDRPGAVATFIGAWLLAWLLTPVVAVIRLIRGDDLTDLGGRGVLERLARARQSAQLQSLRVLSASAVATAGIAGAGVAAGASVGNRAATPASVSGAAAPAKASTPVAAVSVEASRYTVRPGDTLSAIANQYGVSVASLAAANRIAHPDQIRVGDVLDVQLAPYTVRWGDTLSALGMRFGRTVAELAAVNGIKDPNLIVVDQVLQVGGGDLPPVPQTVVKAADPAGSNASTVAAVADPPQPPAPPLVGSGTYTVRPGDTLAAIAARFDTWTQTLVQANHLADANLIVVGQVLQVGGQGANAPKPDPDPAPKPAPARVADPPQPAAPPLVGSGTYTVRPGDTLAAIAARFDTWTATLVQANHLANANAIMVGQVLQVGGQGANAPRPAPKPVVAAAPAPAPVVRPAPPPAPAPARPQPTVSPAPAAVPRPMSAFEACVIQRESSGNPQVWNASGHWGLFQFSRSTWIEYGGSPADFGHASAAVQEQVFANAMARGGQSNWAPYDGC